MNPEYNTMKTRIKLCGLSRPCDIEAANRLMPEYIGFVFVPNSRRYVSYRQALVLKEMLHPAIKAVGVFVDEDVRMIRAVLKDGVIDAVQLHGGEDEAYIGQLREIIDTRIIKAFRMDDERDIARAEASTADCVLLDSGGGTGTAFDWNLLSRMKRPYFLAGGLSVETVKEVIARWHPYGVDVSSGIETAGVKDPEKMRAFVDGVRETCKASYPYIGG